LANNKTLVLNNLGAETMGGLLGTQNWPNFDAWLQNAWGAGSEFSVVCSQFYSVGFVYGLNPPYYLDDFLAVYPKFFGLPTALSGCGTTLGSNVITVTSTAGLNYGQFLQSRNNFPCGTVITDIGSNTITVSTNALVTNANATLMVYESSPIPTGVITLYLRLAWSSLVHKRWCEEWWVAMSLFIAHYCTLYAKSDASMVFETLQTVTHGEVPAGAIPGTAYTLSAIPPGNTLQSLSKNGLFLVPTVDYTLSGNTITLTVATVTNDKLFAVWLVEEQVFQGNAPNGAQIAAQGLAGGIQTSKSVGDVSVSYQVLTALEDWGAWNLTSYGQLLATMARVVGSGPALIW
jgi:hypothetical protein